MKPAVSVIVPVYNVEKYLDRCLESIVNQNFENFELILVDDGSTDCSGKICDLWKEKDTRIKVIHQENKGQSAARNAGIDIARGEYLSFVDSDDIVNVTYLSYLYDMLIDYSADMAGARMERVTEENLSKVEAEIPTGADDIILFDSEEALKKMCRADIIGASSCAKLYKRSLFEDIRYPVGVIHNEDLATTYQILAKSAQIVIGARTIYYYVQHKESILHRPLDEKHMYTVLASAELLEFIKRNYPEIEDAAHIRGAIELLQLIPMLMVTQGDRHGYYKRIRKAMMGHIHFVIRDDFSTKMFKLKCIIIMAGYVPTLWMGRLLMRKHGMK